MIQSLGETLARTVVQVVRGEISPGARWLTDELEVPSDVDTVIFSGGVSEYIADPGADGHNDIGQSLGNQLRQMLNEQSNSFRIKASPGGIRATALGASEFNIQVSGNTGHLSDPGLLLREEHAGNTALN